MWEPQTLLCVPLPWLRNLPGLLPQTWISSHMSKSHLSFMIPTEGQLLHELSLTTLGHITLLSCPLSPNLSLALILEGHTHCHSYCLFSCSVLTFFYMYALLS